MEDGEIIRALGKVESSLAHTTEALREMRAELRTWSASVEERLRALENGRSLVMGAAAVVGAVTSWVVSRIKLGWIGL